VFLTAAIFETINLENMTVLREINEENFTSLVRNVDCKSTHINVIALRY